MALPKQDSFTVTNDTALSDYNANWVSNDGTFQIQSSTDDVFCSVAPVGDAACHWAGDSFNDNQYAQIKVKALAATWNYIGAAVRCASGTTDTWYTFRCCVYEYELLKMIGGTDTSITSTYPTGASVDDVLRLEVSGTTLTPKINGTLWSEGEQTDDSIGSGYAGMSAYYGNSDTRMDDFEGGDLGGGEGCVNVVVVTRPIVVVDWCVP